MAFDFLQKLKWPSQQGFGSSLGLLGAHLMSGGARTTDPAAAQKALASGLNAFQTSMKQDRLDERDRQLHQWRMEELQYRKDARAKELKNRDRMYAAIGSPWIDPDGGRVRTAYDTPPSMDIAGYERADPGQPQDAVSGGQWEMYANMDPMQRRIVAAQAQADPMKATESLMEFQKTASKAPTMTSWFDPQGREQKGYWDNGKWVSVGGPKAKTLTGRGNIATLEAGLAKAQEALAADPTNPALQKSVSRWLGALRKATEWKPDTPDDPDDPNTSKAEWRIRLPKNEDGTLGPVVTSWWDPTQKKRFYRDPETQDIRVKPKGAIFTSPTNTGRERMTASGLYELTESMGEVEGEVNQITRYYEEVAGTPYGWKLVADAWGGAVKTILGHIPDKDEISVMKQKGQVEGLLGRVRKDIVGGGQLSDREALRLIAALGGEPNATRHPEVVRQLLHDIVQEKIRKYNRTSLPMFNNQAALSGVYEQRPELKVPDIFNRPMVPPPKPDNVSQEDWDNMPDTDKELFR